jgi:hypothetical protein
MKCPLRRGHRLPADARSGSRRPANKERPMDPALRQRLLAVHRRQRETHRRLFDLQGESIAGLRDALNAISRTHDEMMVLFESDNALEDIIENGDEERGAGPA